jgi:hypothetical protein
MCRLVGELDHSDTGAKLKELDPLKGLDEQIHKLILGIDVVRLEAPLLQAVSDEVIPHPNMLAPFMKNEIIYQSHSGLAVHTEFHRSSLCRGDHQAVEQARVSELKRWRLLYRSRS